MIHIIISHWKVMFSTPIDQGSLLSLINDPSADLTQTIGSLAAIFTQDLKKQQNNIIKDNFFVLHADYMKLL